MNKKKKLSVFSVVVYFILFLVTIYAVACLGYAVDKSKDANGKISLIGINQTIDSYFITPNLVLQQITDKNSTSFKMVISATFCIVIYVLYKHTDKKRLHRKGVEHGSARWGTEKEAQKLIDKVESNNILLTNDVRMSLNTRQHRENLNVLVIGGSGSGKTRFYVKPNIMQMNTSYVVTDPKGEILRSTGKMLENNGYNIRVFNLIDMKNSHNYNPFAYIYDNNGNVSVPAVIKMVGTLMKNTKQDGSSTGDQFWDDATKTLISALCFFLLEAGEPEDRNFGSLMRLLKYADVKDGDADYKSPLDIQMEKLEEENPMSMAVLYYKDFKKAAGETAKSILISTAVRLQLFNIPEVADLTYTDTIGLDTIGEKKTALFIIIPASDSTFNSLAAMLYTQMFDRLYDIANFKHGGRLPIHVRCMLDEFANIGTIPDFDKLISTMRSMEISANIIIQNLAQLKSKYKDTWEVIMGNCDSHLLLGSSDKSTLKENSEILGKETIDLVAQNKTKGHRNNSTSINNSIQGRDLMTIEELKVMPIEDCILQVRAYYPFYSKKINIEKHRHYKLLEDFDKSNGFDVSKIITLEMPTKGSLSKENHFESASETKKEEIQMSSELIIPDDVDDDIEIGTPVEKLFSKQQQESIQNNSDNTNKPIDESIDDFNFEFIDTSEPFTFDGKDELIYDDGLLTDNN